MQTKSDDGAILTTRCAEKQSAARSKLLSKTQQSLPIAAQRLLHSQRRLYSRPLLQPQPFGQPVQVGAIQLQDACGGTPVTVLLLQRMADQLALVVVDAVA